MKQTIFLNGKFILPKDAKTSVLTSGFLYGWGLFETMRSLNNTIVYFDEHLKRIKNSSRLIDLEFPYSLAKLKEIIKRTVRINGIKDAYVRMTLWKSDSGTDVLVMTRKYQPYSLQKYKSGFRACICSFRQNENSFLARLKTTNYIFYQLAYKEAKKRIFDEAIILNNRGYITEGSRSNIFLVKGEALFTPALECGCLDGITRRVIFDLAKKYRIPVYTGNFTLQDLYEADEAFLTNSLMGVMPLASLERKPIGKDKCRKLTRFFIEKYTYLLR